MTMGGRGTAAALVGAQWGSEGKGVVAGHLAGSFDAAVRVGGPNAGHSLYHDGQLFKMRSVPCLWVNPDARLFVGAGAVVNADLLVEEVASLPGDRYLAIDPNAVLIDHEHENREAETIRQSIGSTAEGVGEARVARIRRDGSARLAGDHDWPSNIVVQDVAWEVDKLMASGARVMLEGTQGSGLSLYHGTRYPYTTSTDTNAGGMAAEAGIAPADVGHVFLVARAYPIRVAGNSGPMGDELSWDWFLEQGIVSEPEQTTVTKKVRRISQWHWPVIDRAVMLNKPCGIWLTFGDYLDPSITGRRNGGIGSVVDDFCQMLETRYGVITMGVGTGPVKDDNGQIVDWATHRTSTRCDHGVAW